MTAKEDIFQVLVWVDPYGVSEPGQPRVAFDPEPLLARLADTSPEFSQKVRTWLTLSDEIIAECRKLSPNAGTR